MSQQPTSREQTGRLILEACAGVHGDVAKQLADAWCAMATESEALRAQVERLQANRWPVAEFRSAAHQALLTLEAATSFTSRKARDSQALVVANLRIALATPQPEPAPVAAVTAMVPLTDGQIAEMAKQEQFLLVCDGLEELTCIVRVVEAHHGIGLTVGDGGANT